MPSPLSGRSWNSGVGGKHFYILVSFRILMTTKNFKHMPMCQEEERKGIMGEGRHPTELFRWN